MAYVSNSIGLNDYVTGTLRAILRSMNMMISTMQQMDRVSQTVGADGFSAMNREVSAAYVQLEQLENQLRQVDLANQRTGNSFGSWSSRIMGAWGALELIQQGVQAIGHMTNFADEFTNANARLSLVRDDGRTQEEFQRQILALSNSTRSSYTATAALVARMGRSEQFRGNNEQAMRFADIVNKSLTISGAGTAEASSVVTQLSQAMSSGVLRGEEFNAVMENGSRLAEAMATELGVGIGELRQMAMDGELTADIVADAIMKAGSVIDEEFSKMPVTFGQNMEIMKNTMGTWLAGMAEAGGALGQLNQMFTELNVFLMSDTGQGLLNGIAMLLFLIIHLLDLAFGGIGSLIAGWEALGTVGDAVIYGVLITGLLLASQAAFAAAAGLWAQVPPLLAAGAAWLWMHAPVVLISLAIGGAIAALGYFGFTAQDVLTFVGGLFSGLGAFLVNFVIVLLNVFGVFVNFLANCFIDPVYAIEALFYNMADKVLGCLNGLISGFINGVNWLIDQVNSKLGTDLDTLSQREIGNPFTKPTSTKSVVEFVGMDYVDMNKWAGAGAEFASGFVRKAGFSGAGFDNGIGSIDTIGTIPNLGHLDDVGEVGKIRADVNIADEDLKLLEDLIIQNRVNQINVTVQTKAPRITNNNTINNGQDFDEFLAGMVDGLDEAVQVSTDEDYDI